MPGILPRLFNAVLPRVKPFSEMGVSGTPVYAGYVLSPEKSSRLIGQEKYRTYSDLLSNTAIVAAGVRYFLNIVAKPNWNVKAVSDKSEAKQYAEFVEDILDDLHTPWSRIIRRCGTYRFHGFAIQEWTAVKRDDGKIGFHDIESRPQWTIWRWEVDERGTVIGAWQRDPLTGRELGLPRGKIMYIVDDTLTDNPEGLGLFRHLVPRADRLTEYEYSEGIGFLRDLRGIPIGRAPISELQASVRDGVITQAQMDDSIETLRRFCGMEKKDEKTSLVLNSAYYVSQTDSGNIVTAQPKWDMQLVSGEAPGLNEVGNAITRLNQEMARILGVEHLLLGADSAGSYALAKEKAQDLYLLANSVLRDIRFQVQHDLLWPLWGLNGFPDDMMPELITEDVSPKDVQKISSTLRDMATAGAVLAPDDPAINDVRDLLGIEQVDLDKLAMEQQPEEIKTGKKRDQAKDEYYEAKTDEMRDEAEEEDVAKRINGHVNGETHFPFDKAWSDEARAASALARRKDLDHKNSGSFTDKDGYRVEIVPAKSGVTLSHPDDQEGDADGRAGEMYIADPKGRRVFAGYWMGQHEDSLGVSKREWQKMPLQEKTSLEAKLQGTGYAPLKEQFRDSKGQKWPIAKYIPGNGTVRARSQNERRVGEMNMVAKPPPHWGAGGKGGYDANEGYFDNRGEIQPDQGPSPTYGQEDEGKAERDVEESENAVRREAATQRNSGGGRPGKTKTRTTRRTGMME